MPSRTFFTRRFAGSVAAIGGGGGGGYNPQPDILWWKGNTGSGTTDPDSSSGSGPACTLSSSSIWGTTFTPGGSSSDLIFVAASSFSAASASAVNYASNQIITLEFRVFQAAYSNATANKEGWLLSGNTSGGGGGAGDFAVYNDTNSNSGRIGVVIDDSAGNPGLYSIARPTDNVWTHYAIIFDGTLATTAPIVYKNGSLDLSITTDFNGRSVNATTFSTKTLFYGANNSSNQFANSSMKDVRIFSGARSSSNILTDATNYP